MFGRIIKSKNDGITGLSPSRRSATYKPLHINLHINPYITLKLN